MKIIRSIEEMKTVTRALKKKGRSLGLVPTMGYLHEGHLSLVRACLKVTDICVVSVFVNPTQFGPNEDFKEYPRDLLRDTGLLEQEGVNFVFAPQPEDMYPSDYKTYVEVHGLQNKLCGKSRPAHFRGVCTVVLKLFNIVDPDIAFFGQKDAQQAIILKRMAEDLNLDVNIKILPIIRDKVGLALSSRNAYLDPRQRQAALVLSRGLKKAQEMFDQGIRESELLLGKIKDEIKTEPMVQLDYAEIVDPVNLEPVSQIKKKALIAAAVFVGTVRLIDNIFVNFEEEKE